MNSGTSNRGKTETSVLKAGNLVAILLGLTISFILTPLIYGGTVGWIAGYGDAQYAQGLGDVMRFIWGPVVAALCTALSVVSLTTGTHIAILAVIKFLNNY